MSEEIEMMVSGDDGVKRLLRIEFAYCPGFGGSYWEPPTPEEVEVCRIEPAYLPPSPDDIDVISYLESASGNDWLEQVILDRVHERYEEGSARSVLLKSISNDMSRVFE